MPQIGFLGPEGTFSQEALEIYLRDKKGYNQVAFSNMREILLAVEDGSIDEAFVPIENSIEGPINEILDLIAFDVDLKIKGEAIVTVRQNLMALNNTDINNIKVILSHPQGIGQCRKYIATNFPNAEVRLLPSTAAAARLVSEGSEGMAAIGSEIAARIYGLDILKRDIQDNDSNATRFVAIGRNDAEKTGNDKTSIVFSTEDKPGSLYRILDIFNLWDINLTRIESRPAKNKLGKYIFFVDMNGHRDDPDVRDALTMVKRKTSFFKLLGSYAVFEDK